MTAIQFIALPEEVVAAYRSLALDANGQLPERHISDGSGIPCRSCLCDVKAGEPYLLLAHRPFPAAQPYAETGPIFIHAEPCHSHTETQTLPEMIAVRKQMLLRGYDADNRIVEGSGQIVASETLADTARHLLTDPRISYLHVRSATNTCFQCCIERL